MPSESQHYQLWTGMVTDDFVEPQHVDRLAATVDQVLGNVVRELLSAGVCAGWEISGEKTVGAGAGLVAGCWCATAAEQEIGGLTAGAVNYVFAVANAESAPAGAVEFAAQTQPVGPGGAVGLGTVELDEYGEVVAVDNHAAVAQRGCFALRTETLQGAGMELAVAPEEEVEIEISHEPLAVPGAIEFSVGEHFSFYLEETWRGEGFVAVCRNEDEEARDLEYAWVRKGIVG